MPVDIAWDNPAQDILRVTVRGRWVWDDLETALRQTIHLLDAAGHKVHFIIDIRDSHLDVGSALGQVKQAATPETHPHEGVKVVVGANRMVRMLYGAYRNVIRAMGKDQVFHFVQSIEEARDLIRRESAQPDV